MNAWISVNFVPEDNQDKDPLAGHLFTKNRIYVLQYNAPNELQVKEISSEVALECFTSIDLFRAVIDEYQ